MLVNIAFNIYNSHDAMIKNYITKKRLNPLLVSSSEHIQICPCHQMTVYHLCISVACVYLRVGVQYAHTSCLDYLVYGVDL